MSREDYEMLKRMNEWSNCRRDISNKRNDENDELIIDDNTVYEIDLDCYECLMREKKKYFNHK